MAQALPDKVIATGFDCTTAFCLSHLGDKGYTWRSSAAATAPPRIRAYSGWHLLILYPLGLSAVTFGVHAIVPTTLILNPTGLIVLYMVVADRSDEILARLGWRRFLESRGELGGYWELPARHEVLNEALKRWKPQT